MAIKRKDNSNYALKTNAQGHKYWARVAPYQKRAKQSLGALGLTSGEDFLESIGQMPIEITDSPTDQRICKEITSSLENALNRVKGLYGESNDPLWDAQSSSDEEDSSDTFSYQECLEMDLEEYLEEKEQLAEEFEQAVSKLDSEYAESQDEQILQEIEEAEKTYRNRRLQLALEFENVVHLDPDAKRDYVVASIRQICSNPDSLYVITHDRDTFEKFYGTFIATEAFQSQDSEVFDDEAAYLGDSARDEVNKIFGSAYGITFSATEDGVQVPTVNIAGKNYGRKLAEVQRAGMMSAWAGVEDQGIRLGENTVHPRNITQSIVRDQRIRTFQILGGLILGRLVKRALQKRLYGYAPYIRYDQELRSILREYQSRQTRLLQEEQSSAF